MPPAAGRAPRLALTALLLAYGVVCLRHPGEFHAIDHVNLPIHETGHLVFAPFGDLVTALGGTIFELLVPAAFVAYFLRRGDRHAASVALWWVAENFWYIAVYIADARAQELPLVGGGEHDWAFILAEMGWLARDASIARAVHVTGVVLFVVAIVGGLLAAMAPAADGVDAAAPGERPAAPGRAA